MDQQMEIKSEVKELDTLQHGTKIFPCPDCPKQFKRKDMFWAHQSSDHSGPTIGCDECNRVFSSEMLLENHLVKAHMKKLSCSVCGKKYQSRVGLVAHENLVHNGSRKFECKNCHKLFVSQVRGFSA